MRILTRCPRRVQYLLNFSSPILTRLVRKKKFGRHGWDYTVIFKYLLIKQACGLTYRDLEAATDIHNSTFVKARRIFATKQVFLKFFRHLVKVLIAQGYLTCEYVAIDGSFVKTYSRRKKEGSAWWGKTEAYGFKLHALVDVKT